MNDEYNVTDSDTLEQDIGESIIDSVSEDVSTDNGSNITVIINNPSSEKGVSELEEKDSIKETDEFVLKDVTVEVKSVTPQNTDGLKSQLLSVIGTYDTVVTDYTYQNTQGYTQHSIDVQPDYVWICTFGIFLVCIYSMFRLYGLVFGKGGRR